jgi:hypothetical protein
MSRNRGLSLKPKAQNSNIKLVAFVKFLNFIFLLYTLHFTHYTFSYAQEQFVYDSKNKRDPFIPLVTPEGRLLKLDEEEAAMGSLSLEGIIYDKNGLSYAVVNGEVIKVGDSINNYQVLKIEKNRVIFIKEGQPTEVRLKEEEP